jgi:N6-adenosine-specific RNA methylase IME4
MAKGLPEKITAGDVARFDPKAAKRRDAQTTAVIEYAQRIKDWPLLKCAIEEKIEDQAEFVQWWREKVTPNKGARTDLNARGRFSLDQAEHDTGISQQQVSKWSNRLRDREAYRQRLYGVAWRAAMGLAPDVSDIKRRPVVLPVGKYQTIVCDPPWPMQKIEREVRPNQFGFEYPTMSEDELLAYPVVTEAADNAAHLWLWTTQRFLPLALGLVEEWGFDYLCTFVWHKPGGYQAVGLPQYNCEFVVMGRRGGLAFDDTKSFPTCFEAPRREHSRKPDEFYEMVRRVSPGPRLDMFSREAREGFDQHGIELEHFAEAAE